MRIVHQYRFSADAQPAAFDHSAVHSRSRGLRAAPWQATVRHGNRVNRSAFSNCRTPNSKNVGAPGKPDHTDAAITPLAFQISAITQLQEDSDVGTRI
jgi:hypothetical protein